MEDEVRSSLRLGAQGGVARLAYTGRAFRMLPRLERPCILDIGCGRGRGGPTLELARLSNGLVIGLDIDAPALEVLSGRALEAGLAERVEVLHGSMQEIGLSDRSIDVVWAEGAISAIGFARGLRRWQRLIKPAGFLVVHDMVWLRDDPPRECADQLQGMFPGLCTVEAHLEKIPRQGYKLLWHFCLPEEVWWQDYYGPVADRIQALRAVYAGDVGVRAILNGAQRQVDWYDRCAGWYGSAFFGMQRSRV